MKIIFVLLFLSQISQGPVLSNDKIDLSIADDVIQNAKAEKEKIEECLNLMEITISCKRKNIGLLAKIITSTENSLLLLLSFQEDAHNLSVALLNEIKNREKMPGGMDREEHLRCMAKYQELRSLSKISLKSYYKKIHQAAKEVDRILNKNGMASLGKTPSFSFIKTYYF